MNFQVLISYDQPHTRATRMRQALGICIRRLETEIADDVAELDWCDRRTDELLSSIIEKRARVRQLTDASWRVVGRRPRLGAERHAD